MDTWILKIWDYVKEIGEGAAIAANHYLGIIAKEGDSVSSAWLIFWIALLLLMMTSGCWAISIAKSRRHDQLWKFMLLGFFLPLGAPIYLLFKLPIFGEDERKQELQKAKQQRLMEKAEKEKARIEQIKAENPDATPQNLQWNKTVLDKIATKADGTPAGPWAVTFDGAEMRVETILETFEDFVQVRVSGSKDGAFVDIRMPYTKITAWNDIQ